MFVTLSVCVTIVAASAFIAQGGPLDPPNGPVASTMMTLDEIEPSIPLGQADLPIIIDEPGAYHLTGDLSASDFGSDAITVDVAHVLIDLRGFSIRNTQAGAFNCAIVINAPYNVTITNGTIYGAQASGIEGFGADACVVEGLRVQSCGSRGIQLGDGAIVRRVSVAQNTVYGLQVGRDAIVEHASANANGNVGILAGASSTVSHCVSRGNGTIGISIDSGGTASECTAEGNATVGFAGSALEHFPSRCTSLANNIGFYAGTGSAIEACVAADNTQSGIRVEDGSTVRSCTSTSNGGHGIHVTNRCLVIANMCRFNDNGGTGAGVYAEVSDNRIEGNQLVFNGRGLDVDGSRNVIIRNHARANGQNFAQVNAGNIVGTIVNDAGVMNASENDFVNFSF